MSVDIVIKADLMENLKLKIFLNGKKIYQKLPKNFAKKIQNLEKEKIIIFMDCNQVIYK